MIRCILLIDHMEQEQLEANTSFRTTKVSLGQSWARGRDEVGANNQGFQANHFLNSSQHANAKKQNHILTV